MRSPVVCARLGSIVRVHVGGVDEVDPDIQGFVDDADRVLVVGVADRAEHHRAERVAADLVPVLPSVRYSMASALGVV
jgi:hypothetical protein